MMPTMAPTVIRSWRRFMDPSMAPGGCESHPPVVCSFCDCSPNPNPRSWTMDSMDAWVVDHPDRSTADRCGGSSGTYPEPGPGQVRVRVSCCGVCRTDLHLAEGDLPPKRPQVTPGHEVVGMVDALGAGRASRFAHRRPGRRGLAGAHRRQLPVLPPRRREPLPRARPSPAGTSTAGTPTTAWSRRRSRTCCRTRSTTSRPRRCSAPGSSATGPAARRRARPAARSASTASAAAPT